jgi:hypothetical protein
VRFVTFNYDTLLEAACEQALGLGLTAVAKYVSTSYRIYKPHGSVNWVRFVEHGDHIDPGNVEHSIIKAGDTLKLVDDGYYLWRHEGASVHSDGHFVFSRERLASRDEVRL